MQIHPPVRRQPSVEQQATALFAGPVATEAWGRLVGAPDGAMVHALPWKVASRPAVRLELHHAWLDGPALRSVFQDGDQHTAIYNEFMRVRDDAPDGIGTRILAHQVLAARALGVAYIATDAEGSPASTFNGFYTWARLGFNGDVPAAVARVLPDRFRDVTDLLDLLDRPGGAQWWRAHGRSFFGTFDLADGSRSLRVLADYTSGKGIAI